MLSFRNLNTSYQVLIITLDTNVLFAALYSSAGASYKILKLIIDEKIRLSLTVPVYFEYVEVLTSEENLKKFELSKEEISDVIDLLILLAKKQKIYYLLRPNLIDESDNIFTECAFASNSEFIITNNIKHYKTGQLKESGFTIITPKNFYRMWKEKYE